MAKEKKKRYKMENDGNKDKGKEKYMGMRLLTQNW